MGRGGSAQPGPQFREILPFERHLGEWVPGVSVETAETSTRSGRKATTVSQEARSACRWSWREAPGRTGQLRQLPLLTVPVPG